MNDLVFRLQFLLKIKSGYMSIIKSCRLQTLRECFLC